MCRVTTYLKQNYFKRKYFFFFSLMCAWHLNEKKFPFEKWIWVSKVWAHLPNNKDDWMCVVSLCVQLFLPLGCWIQEFRPHWKTLQRAYVLLHSIFLPLPVAVAGYIPFSWKGGILFCFKLVGYIMMKYLLYPLNNF